MIDWWLRGAVSMGVSSGGASPAGRARSAFRNPRSSRKLIGTSGLSGAVLVIDSARANKSAMPFWENDSLNNPPGVRLEAFDLRTRRVPLHAKLCTRRLPSDMVDCRENPQKACVRMIRNS